jgi:addiction module HigA family antidote
MAMHSPPHPGRIVKQECLAPLGVSVTAAARQLGVSRVALSEMVNERRGISPEMAIRLSKAFGQQTRGLAGLQMQYDLAQALKKADQITVTRITLAA